LSRLGSEQISVRGKEYTSNDDLLAVASLFFEFLPTRTASELISERREVLINEKPRPWLRPSKALAEARRDGYISISQVAKMECDSVRWGNWFRESNPKPVSYSSVTHQTRLDRLIEYASDVSIHEGLSFAILPFGLDRTEVDYGDIQVEEPYVHKEDIGGFERDIKFLSGPRAFVELSIPWGE